MDGIESVASLTLGIHGESIVQQPVAWKEIHKLSKEQQGNIFEIIEKWKQQLQDIFDGKITVKQ